MEITGEQYQRLCRFLDADMTLEEMNDFERELDVNPALREQLNFELSVRNNIPAVKQDAGSGKPVITLSDNAGKSPAQGMQRLIKPWAVAAALIVIAGASILVMLLSDDKKANPIVKTTDTLSTKKNDTSQYVKEPTRNSNTTVLANFFRQYFEMDTLPGKYPMYLAEAFSYYESGDYSYIQKLNLEDIPELRGGADEKKQTAGLGHYYKGITQLKTGKNKEAITSLQWVNNNSDDKMLQEKARWYLALAYIQADDKENAIRSLKLLIEKSTYDSYKNKAKNLLESIPQ